MRLIFLLASICVIITGGFFTIDNDSFALSCAPINMTKSVEETQIIFSGKVLSTEKYEPSLQSSFNVVTSFAITENFKGTNEKTIKVFSDETWGPFFEEGLEYLVFADKLNDKIQAQLCSPTDRVGNSEIKLVRNLTNSNSTLQPQIELKIIPEKVRYGESLTYHYSLPSYDNPDEQYIHKVINPDGVVIDSTLWFARQDSEYEFRTNHFSYNITSAGKFSIVFEKAELLQPTGEIVKTLFFEITTNPPPLKQFKLGVPLHEIRCNDSRILVHQIDTLKPACVFHDSELIFERKWAKMRIGMPAEIITQEKLCLWYSDDVPKYLAPYC